ncbi:MAG: NIL domain-containing protein, partial [Pseudomonadota bacterium]
MYSKMISLRFPEKVVNEPVVVNLVKKFDLTFNILKATIY